MSATLLASSQELAMRKFREAGAFSPESAVSLEALHLDESRDFHSLLVEGVFRETDSNTFWIDCRAARALQKRRLYQLLIVVGVVVASFVISYL